jgi:hypothetical protein
VVVDHVRRCSPRHVISSLDRASARRLKGTSVMLEGTPSQPPSLPCCDGCCVQLERSFLHLILAQRSFTLRASNGRRLLPHRNRLSISILCAAITTRPAADQGTGSLRFDSVYRCILAACAPLLAAASLDRLRPATHRHRHHHRGRALFHISVTFSFACVALLTRYIPRLLS